MTTSLVLTLLGLLAAVGLILWLANRNTGSANSGPGGGKGPPASGKPL